MSRRRRPADPVGRQVADLSDGSEFRRILHQVLTERTTPIAAEIVTLRLMEGDGFDAIARKLTYSESRVRQIYSRTLSNLQKDPPEALRAFLQRDFARIMSARGVYSSASELLTRKPDAHGMWCDRHNCSITYPELPLGITTCVMCPCPIESADSENRRAGGRPRRFCSPACRQAAARQQAKVLREKAEEIDQEKRGHRLVELLMADPRRTAPGWA